MRDFDAIKKKEMSSIENRIRHIYNVGYEDCLKDQQKVKDEAYKQGLKDAWECCKRFLNSDDKVCDKIFGVSGWADFLDQSPSDAIEKFKEYDEKQEHIIRCCKNCKHSENGMVGNSKRCEDCYYDRVSRANTLFEPMETDSKIEVGDEVYVPDLNEYATVISMVSDDSDFVCVIRSNGEPLLCKKDTVNLTGNHSDSIVDLLKRLEKRNA